MGRLLELATSTEKPLRTRFGRWMLEVSKVVDSIAGGGQPGTLTLPEQSSVPAAVPNAGVVFTLDVNGIAELFFREDNGNIVQLTSNGQVLGYLTQTDWAVNPQTGNDTNAGTSVAPLASLAELARRWDGRTFAPAITSVNVSLSGTFAATDTLILAGAIFTSTVVLTVSGTMSTFDSGSVTAFTAMNPATATRATLTDAAQDFTGSVRKRIRMTSGAANGAISWVCSLGGGVTVANVGQFWANNALFGAAATPGIGDTYVIEDFTTSIQRYFIDLDGPVITMLRDIQFVGTASATDVSTSYFGPMVNQLKHKVYGCSWSFTGFATQVVTGNQSLMACSAVWDNNSGSGLDMRQGIFVEAGCCWFALTQLTVNAQIQGFNNIHDGNGTLHVGRYALNDAYEEDFDHRGFFGCVNGTIAELMRIDDGGIVIMSVSTARFWGTTGNTATNALRVRNSAGFLYVTLPTATAATPTSDVVLANAAAIAWAALPATAVAPNNAYAVVKQ